jgi:hypothetical protein
MLFQQQRLLRQLVNRRLYTTDIQSSNKKPPEKNRRLFVYVSSLMICWSPYRYRAQQVERMFA